MRSMSLTEARENWFALLKEVAEHDLTVYLTYRGKPRYKLSLLPRPKTTAAHR